MAAPNKWQTATEAELQSELDRMVAQLSRYERQAQQQRLWIERLRALMAERFPHPDQQPPGDWIRRARSESPRK